MFSLHTSRSERPGMAVVAPPRANVETSGFAVRPYQANVGSCSVRPNVRLPLCASDAGCRAVDHLLALWLSGFPIPAGAQIRRSHKVVPAGGFRPSARRSASRDRSLEELDRRPQNRPAYPGWTLAYARGPGSSLLQTRLGKKTNFHPALITPPRRTQWHNRLSILLYIFLAYKSTSIPLRLGRIRPESIGVTATCGERRRRSPHVAEILK